MKSTGRTHFLERVLSELEMYFGHLLLLLLLWNLGFTNCSFYNTNSGIWGIYTGSVTWEEWSGFLWKLHSTVRHILSTGLPNVWEAVRGTPRGVAGRGERWLHHTGDRTTWHVRRIHCSTSRLPPTLNVDFIIQLKGHSPWSWKLKIQDTIDPRGQVGI